MRWVYRQEVGTLPIPPVVREKLLQRGFRTVGDLENIGPVDLADESGITRMEAAQVIRAAFPNKRRAAAKTAMQLWEEEKAAPRIITFCQAVDKILGGGIATREVTEIYGPPGVGKTQIGMQLAIDVQIPPIMKGAGGAAVYIDTEGSFFLHRARQMAEHAVHHIQALGARSNCRDPAVLDFTVTKVLSNIHYFRVLDYAKQLAVTNSLDGFIEQHPEVKLVVVDSVAFHFRQGFTDFAKRSRVLVQMAQKLARLAEKRKVAIVFMNHITTRFRENGERILVASLGETWASCARNRVRLSWEGGQRMALMEKSPYLPPVSAPYWITSQGIRGPSSKQGQPSR
ncbi:hypothetical protein BSKO_10798 [Bryopsis sp. KO-2023]|nr:hypothetical protein BSKO_10798 [Bryopsis sp. KO-2023]